MSRRDLMKLAGAGVGMAVLGAILAASRGGKGTPGTSSGASAAASGGASASAGASASGGAAGAIQPPATAVNLDFWNPFTGGDGPFLRGIVDTFNKETP